MPRARIFAKALAVAVTVGLPGTAWAACNTTATGVAFGAYDTQSVTPDDAAGTIAVQCTSSEGWFVWANVSLGTGNSGSYAARRMTSGANQLQYNLYSDTARTQVWGNGSAGTVTVNIPVFFGNGSRSVYGRIPASQMVDAGTYGDLIVVTVEY